MPAINVQSEVRLRAPQLLWLNECYQQLGRLELCLPSVSEQESGVKQGSLLRLLKAQFHRPPKVTVVLLCHNASAVINDILVAWQQQSLQPWRILVVDNASTDETPTLLSAIAAKDKRIRVIRLAVRLGDAAALNEGIAKAKSSLILVSCAVFWVHPKLIEQLVNPLSDDAKLLAAFGYYAVEGKDEILCLPEPAVPSVLVLRRSLLKSVGFFDRVRAIFLAEYQQRIKAAFNERSVFTLNAVPLGLTEVLHSKLAPANLLEQYLQSAANWHCEGTRLFIPKSPLRRPFAIPGALCEGTEQARQHRQLNLLQTSTLFDANWYGHNYADVTAAGMDPALHYLRYGGQENRDPGPDFSSSGYRLLQPLATDANPLLHYLESMEESLESPEKSAELTADYGTVQQTGQCEVKPDKPWLMLVAHAAGPELYGAERSLLDVLDALQQLGCNVLLTLPGSRCPAYFQQLAARVQQLAVLPYGWWHDGHPESPQTIARFAALLKQYRVQLCYCNTLVLSAPLYAARQLLVPTVVHVRELPEADPALCQQLGADATQIRQHLLALADGFIANSKRTAVYLDAPERTRVVPNVVDTARFAAIAPRAQQTPLRLGMLSSNLPKKGLQDFIRLSQLLAEQAQDIECWLFGPDNDHVAQYRAEQAAGRLPPSLIFAGYSLSPEAALAELDIVVNLSHFEESFGRTVLEAMAAGRCVIAYQWGALPELIEHNQTGILVPFGQVDAVAGQVVRLSQQPELRKQLALAAQQQALANYSQQALQQQLGQWLAEQGFGDKRPQARNEDV